MRRKLALILIVLLCAVSLSAQSRRPITFEDMMKLKRIGEFAVSPDGRWTLFSAVEVNLDENTRTPHLWVVPVAGGEARHLTTGKGESRPQWAPDGKRFLYITDSGDGAQVHVQDISTDSGELQGEARKVTSISTEAGGALWSPDGAHILFVSEVYPDCKDDACNKQRDEARAKSKVKATIFTRLLYRHWSAYSIGKRSHLFVVPAEGGVARDLTPGDHDVPPFSLGGQDMYAFSPDGKEVAYTSNIDEVEATSTNNELFIVPVAGGAAKKISTSPGSDSTPVYSPDGRYIAWRMQVRPGYEADRFRLVLYERATGKLTDLTPNFDRWVDTFAWAPDSSRIYFTAEDAGESPVYSLAVTGGTPQELFRGSNGDVVVTRDGKTLVFSRVSVQYPAELFKADISGAKPAVSALTSVNEAVLAQVHTAPLEPFWFVGAEKTKVHGFIVKPPGFDEKKKYPVKFLMHGGPQGAWGDSWSYRWNPQMFAADGYVVVMINRRGSTGYGQRFTDQVNADWGGRAYQDLMLGLDHVEANYPYVEKGRACALGASYGGYMANWILGHTDRFKCVVSHDGLFSLESMYGTTEELWFPEWEFRGAPWQNRQLYLQWSPHLHAAKFKTPTLVVHGQLDYRVDVSEGFQLFTALQRQKVPSKMLYFPDEGHWVLKPQNSRLWYQTVNRWVDSYLKP